MRYQFYTADVFTDTRFGGNPLAVLPDAGGLSTQQMQQIAREFNLSETVFAFPPDDPDHARRLRIFTPYRELPFAGHPTVGTAFVLATIGEIPLSGNITRIVFEEGVGPVPVTITTEQGQPFATQLSVAQLPERGAPPPASDALAAILSLDPSELLNGADAPEAFSCGVPFLFIALRNRDAVTRARLDRGRWEATLASYWAPNLYVFAYDALEPDAQIHARAFVPEAGIEEDPATGSAAAALAGYLAARSGSTSGTLAWLIEQGYAMGRPSRLEVEADLAQGNVTAVRVGGRSVMVSEGTIDLS